MSRENRRDTKTGILKVGAEIVHNKGFNNTGIQEILKGAGVPKGSFYFYFRNKEDFGLQLIDFYAEVLFDRLERCRARDELSPLQRLQGFFSDFLDIFERNQCRGGCPIGNMAQEMGDLNEAFRVRLEQVFARMRAMMAELLDQARAAGEVAPELKPGDVAEFILNSWQGAMLQMKVVKSTEPLKIFERVVFGDLLHFIRKTDDM
jgi:TetR/AcrR family transcriptional repressor of nem operon